MTDNNLFALLIGQIEAAIANAGWTYLVSQKNQPEQEGVPTEGCVFYEKLFDHHYGHPIVKEEYQEISDDFSELQTQLTETTLQITALIPQDPSDLSLPTASDVADYVCRYLQTRKVMGDFWVSKVTVLRVTEVRAPFVVLDRDRFEGHPSFDIVLQHAKELSLTVPSVSRIVGAVSPIPGDPTVGVFVVENN